MPISKSEVQSDYGERLLPRILDGRAKSEPDRTLALIPRDQWLNGGFQEISNAQIANAVNYTAWWLQSIVGTDKLSLTYLGVPDLRYNIILYAAMKCGHKLVLPSPHNNPSTNLALIQGQQSEIIIHSSELKDLTHKVGPGLELHEIEPLQTLLAASSKVFDWQQSFEDVKDQPVLTMFSSGSTGTPKAITSTHGTLAVCGNNHDFPKVPGRRTIDSTLWDFEKPGLIYSPIPQYHGIGLIGTAVYPLFTNSVPVFGTAGPPSVELITKILTQVKLRGIVLPPVFLERLVHDESAVKRLANLDFVSFGGGPLSQATGDKLSESVQLCSLYGSTETGGIRQLMLPRKDWNYFEFHPNESISMKPYEGLYEMIVHGREELRDHSWLSNTFPGIKDFETKDLFKPHPTRKGLWKFYGRKNDVLVMSTGDKLFPLPVELGLQEDKAISGALLVANGRHEPALLLESCEDQLERDEFLKMVWPRIEAIDATLPDHGKIDRSMVHVVSADQKFVRAGKGTVERKATETRFAMEIDALYKRQKKTPHSGQRLYDV